MADERRNRFVFRATADYISTEAEGRFRRLRPLLSIIVHATWDDDAKVWVATSGDIDGLAVEAETIEILEPKVIAAIADLIELNGVESSLPEIPVYIMAEQLSRVANPQF